MKQLNFLLIICLSTVFNTAYAHQDFSLTRNYGNIKVRITTGYNYEEINKAFIIGQLAEQIVKDLHYSEQIFLDFHHHYVGDCSSDYFISYDKGAINNTWANSEKGKDFLNKKAIVIRQVSRKFIIETTLKLLQYSITNLSAIKISQKTIDYNKNFCQWNINTIDTNLIKKQLKTENSHLLQNILQLKIERQKKGFTYGVSYFWQNNHFHIFFRKNNQDTVLLVLDNVYDINQNIDYSAMIFDTDSSFYHIQYLNKLTISKRNVIINTNNNFQPFEIIKIGLNKLAIQYWYYSLNDESTKERTLIYLIEKDELIQDLDVLILQKH